jgi:hypothetical protein
MHWNDRWSEVHFRYQTSFQQITALRWIPGRCGRLAAAAVAFDDAFVRRAVQVPGDRRPGEG